MTHNELSFIEAYFGPAKLNATEAYRLSDYADAGVNAKIRAYELMKKPIIKAEMDRRMEERLERAELTAGFLIEKLLEIIDKEQSRNPQAALRAIELAGKSMALWKERQEISGPDGEAIKHEQHVKESVADFTTKLESLASRATGTDGPGGEGNVVRFPDRPGEGGA